MATAYRPPTSDTCGFPKEERKFDETRLNPSPREPATESIMSGSLAKIRYPLVEAIPPYGEPDRLAVGGALRCRWRAAADGTLRIEWRNTPTA
jgi:hypothetical protein